MLKKKNYFTPNHKGLVPSAPPHEGLVACASGRSWQNKNINSFIIKTVGRRKSAIAQIQITKGTGNFFINGKPASLYMQENQSFLLAIQAPLELLALQKTFQIFVNVKGGGLAGQAEAIGLGIARALCLFDNTYKNNIKKRGFLTRDARVKERKKYGLKKARKAPQFSKR